MDDSLRQYCTVATILCALAAGVTLLVWWLLPVAPAAWYGVVWFVLLTTMVELLAVHMPEGSGGVTLTPVSPILWAATCVLGPFPGIVVCLASSIISTMTKILCARIADAWEQHSVVGGVRARLRNLLFRAVQSIGASWQVRSAQVTVLTMAAYAASLILDVGPAGLVYSFLGGQFLVNAEPGLNVVNQFGLPFLGLVLTSASINAGEYAILVGSAYPIPGVSGIRGIVLRMRLAIVETALPLGKAQLFMSVVALLLAYLYSQIGVLGFVLAITPVVALRDFFHQWVEERSAYMNTITSLATYMQHYHPYTRGHLKRVADMSERLARELRLPVESIRHMNTAAFLHDIGKVGVSEEILDKTTKLTDEEWATIKEHPVKGAEIIGHLEFLDTIVDWIKYHHKWYDGRGYPDTNGDNAQVPIEAAIIATADAFDAMTDDRELSLDWECDSCGHKPEEELRPTTCPNCGAEKRRRYREPKSLDEAVDEIRRGSGTQFHPKVVKAFLTMLERDGIRLNA